MAWKASNFNRSFLLRVTPVELQIPLVPCELTPSRSSILKMTIDFNDRLENVSLRFLLFTLSFSFLLKSLESYRFWVKMNAREQVRNFSAVLASIRDRHTVLVFRRPLISHEASPFTAAGQVNRICDEASDEASDERRKVTSPYDRSDRRESPNDQANANSVDPLSYCSGHRGTELKFGREYSAAYVNRCSVTPGLY